MFHTPPRNPSKGPDAGGESGGSGNQSRPDSPVSRPTTPPLDPEEVRRREQMLRNQEYAMSYVFDNEPGNLGTTTKVNFKLGQPTARSTGNFVNNTRGSGRDISNKDEDFHDVTDIQTISQIQTKIDKLLKDHIRENRSATDQTAHLLAKIEEVLHANTQPRVGREKRGDSGELREFIKTLFTFDGNSTNLQRFLHICDCARAVVRSERDEKFLIDQILAHLDAPAFNKCAFNKNFDSYEELKRDLLRLFGTVKTVGQVQDDINRLRQGSSSLIEYGNKATQLLSELSLAAHSQYGEKLSKLNKPIYEEAVTRAYVRGLHENLKLMVAAGQPALLRDAIQSAENFQEGGFVTSGFKTPHNPDFRIQPFYQRNSDFTQGFGQRPRYNQNNTDNYNQRFPRQNYNNTRRYNDTYQNDAYQNDNTYRYNSNSQNNYQGQNNTQNNYRRNPYRQNNNFMQEPTQRNVTFAPNQGRNNSQSNNTFQSNQTRGDMFAPNPARNPQSTPFPNQPRGNTQGTSRRHVNCIRRFFSKPHCVRIKSDLAGRDLLLLVDTGSDVSILNNKIGTSTQTPQGERLKLIYGETEYWTLGSILNVMTIQDILVPHMFCVASDNQLPVDGIIGMDFLELYDAVINLGEQRLFLNYFGNFLSIPLICYYTANATEDTGQQHTPDYESCRGKTSDYRINLLLKEDKEHEEVMTPPQESRNNEEEGKFILEQDFTEKDSSHYLPNIELLIEECGENIEKGNCDTNEELSRPLPGPSNRLTGVVEWYVVKKGYGFIKCNETQVDVHRTAIDKNRTRRFLIAGEKVEFDITQTRKKSAMAINVTGPNGEALKGRPIKEERDLNYTRSRNTYPQQQRRSYSHSPRETNKKQGSFSRPAHDTGQYFNPNQFSYQRPQKRATRSPSGGPIKRFHSPPRNCFCNAGWREQPRYNYYLIHQHSEQCPKSYQTRKQYNDIGHYERHIKQNNYRNMTSEECSYRNNLNHNQRKMENENELQYTVKYAK